VLFASDLTWIILLPALGSLATLASSPRIARWMALLFTAATFALSVALFFRIAVQGYHFGDLDHLPDFIHLRWLDFTAGVIHFRIDYFLGVDGLSLPLVILNALLSLLAIIGGWQKPRVKEYMALLLILEAGVMGVFLALDLLLFFLFWEVELAPMFLLIGGWGHEAMKHGMPGRVYSAWKFLLYTFFGSTIMLVGILLFYFKEGGQTASMQCLSATTITASMDCPFTAPHILAGSVSIPLTGAVVSWQLLTFLLIFVAFAVKIPMFPLHTWLPDAHTDAPTEVSVILAGILLKMGAYGLIRVGLMVLPQGVHAFAGPLAVIAVINILYGAGICLVQTDMKRLVAYSSVSHMGVILLGVAAAAGLSGSDQLAFRTAALAGATIQMVSHGLITGLLFFCVGVIYDHAHTREIDIFGGVAKKMPLLATLFTFAGLASLGLPGLIGFVAEYMTFTSSYRVWPAETVASVFTMILTCAYLLWMLKRIFYGPFNIMWNRLTDATVREAIPLFALAAFIVFIGIYPKFLIDVITPTLTALMHAASLTVR